ncbi:MAG: hypothetical protein ACMG6S_10335 [Byssovorax sp.]
MSQFHPTAFIICPDVVSKYHLDGSTGDLCKGLPEGLQCDAHNAGEPGHLRSAYTDWVTAHPNDGHLPFESGRLDLYYSHYESWAREFRHKVVEWVKTHPEDERRYAPLVEAQFYHSWPPYQYALQMALGGTSVNFQVPLQNLEARGSDPGFFCQFRPGTTRHEFLDVFVNRSDVGVAVIVKMIGAEECSRHNHGHDLVDGLSDVCSAKRSKVDIERANENVRVVWRAFWATLATRTSTGAMRKCLPHTEDD